MNRNLGGWKRSLSAFLLVLLFFCMSGCGSGSPTTTDGSTNPPPLPKVYSVSTQADFTALRQVTLNGGDQILFERGRHFDGYLSLKRSDVRPNTVITVADYGSSGNPRPVIEADVDDIGAIDIRDSGGWLIEDLEIINYSAQRSERFGVLVKATNSGRHENFVIRNCLIHDVSGEFDNRDNGGIVFRVTGKSVPTWFDGVLLENNEIRDISGVGIRIKSVWQSSPSDPRGLSKQLGRYALLNVVVRGNRVSNTTYNAIIIASADAPLAEYNTIGPNISTEHTGNSLYFFATDSAVAQYNEAFGNTGPATDKDRAGYDADYGSRNTVFRYNYSHDNNFGFSIMRKYGDGIQIHHNISENERFAFFNYGFPSDNAVNDVVVSNNTFYSDQPNMQMFRDFDKTRNPIETSFIDNIFVFAAGGATWGSEATAGRGNVFSNNIVIGLEEASYDGMTGDPLLAAPGIGGTDIDMSSSQILQGYKLCLGSPAIDVGRSDDNDASVDFWREKIDAMNIGVYGGIGENCEP